MQAADEACKNMLKVKRGLAFVYLHYIYWPLRFRWKQREVHQFLMRKRKSTSTFTMDLEESVANAEAHPFHALLPDGRHFVEAVLAAAPEAKEVQRTLPAKRQMLRKVLVEWQQALTITPRIDCCGKYRRRYFSRAPLWVRRNVIFDDAVDAFLAAKRTQLLSGVHVRFIGADGQPELGVDSGGLSREFFELALKEITREHHFSHMDRPDPDSSPVHGASEPLVEGFGEPMFCQQDDKALMVVASSRPLAVYFALGRLLATALVHASHGDAALPLGLNDCLLKNIVGQPITAADVRRRDPVYYENRINTLLKPGGIELMASILCIDTLTFQEEGVELKPGGAGVEVNETNVEEYVALLSEHYVCDTVRKQLSHVIAGFEDIIPREILRRCSIGFADLGMLLSGVPSLDVDEWRTSAHVRAAGVDEELAWSTSEWLWEVLKSWEQEELALLLAFATGCSRLPAVGFGGLDPPFQVEVVPLDSTGHLPTSHTCMNSLTLPAYESCQELAAKLSLAVREGAGSFDLR